MRGVIPVHLDVGGAPAEAAAQVEDAWRVARPDGSRARSAVTSAFVWWARVEPALMRLYWGSEWC